MSDFEISLVGSLEAMQHALGVRRAVFIEEQGVPEALEIDEHDGDPTQVSTALHILVTIDGAAVATGRLLLDADDHAHIGRVAVLSDFRGRGTGRAVMDALQELARERGYTGVTLAAQLHALGFYERFGYTARGDVFLDAGIEHRWMDRSLT